jgi:hypothetical protein
MRKFLTASAVFSVVALTLNAPAMSRTAPRTQPAPFSVALEHAAELSVNVGGNRVRAWSEQMARIVGAGSERLDVTGDGDRYLLAGDSVMVDLAPALAAAIDERSDGASRSYKFTIKGSAAGNVLWGWEDALPAEVRRTGADIVMLVLTVDAGTESEYYAAAAFLVDQALAAGARQVVWIEHPVSADGEFEQGRALRHRALVRLGRRADVIVLDPSDAIVNSSGGYTAHLVTGSGPVVRVRERDGIHLTPAGAELVAEAVVSRLGL